MTSSIKFAFASSIVAVAALGATSASALTLNTTGLKANAALVFSPDASGAMKAANVTYTNAGTATKLPDVDAKDNKGNPIKVGSFNLPVTKVDVSIGSSLNIIPNYGLSNGAALRFATPNLGGDAILANFNVNFKTKTITADLIDVFLKTTETAVPLYTFEEVKPQVVSLKGLVLNEKNYLGKLVFTPTMVQKLGDALLIDTVLRASLATLDWGTINVEVTSFKRSPAVSDKAFTIANVK
jgi:hypothetical protein